MATGPIENTVLRRLGEMGLSGSASVISLEQVGEELRASAAVIVANAPIYALTPMFVTYNHGTTSDPDRLAIDTVSTTEMYVQVPNDMARFVRIQAASWDVPAQELLSDTQATKYRGNTIDLDPLQAAVDAYPRCVLTSHVFSPETDLRPAFRLYPAETPPSGGDDPGWPQSPPGGPMGVEVVMDHFWYIPDPSPYDDLPPILADAMIWDAVARILQSDEDKAYLAPQANQRRDMVLRAVVDPVKSVTYRRPIYLQ